MARDLLLHTQAPECLPLSTALQAINRVGSMRVGWLCRKADLLRDPFKLRVRDMVSTERERVATALEEWVA